MINICLVENDILLDHPVTLPKAVLGAKVEVSTINGAVKMPIPLTANTGIILL
jgi:DnaJ-class molecular chaperone